MEALVKRLCEDAVADGVFPGCVAGYYRDGRTTVVPAGRLTYADEAPHVSAETVYDVASITKCVPTSCLILHLVERGLLDLDDKVVDYIPEIQNEYRNRILIRH